MFDPNHQRTVCAPPRFESLQHANRVLSDWIQFYNEVRPHQALGMKPPVEAYALSS